MAYRYKLRGGRLNGNANLREGMVFETMGRFVPKNLDRRELENLSSSPRVKGPLAVVHQSARNTTCTLNSNKLTFTLTPASLMVDTRFNWSLAHGRANLVRKAA